MRGLFGSGEVREEEERIHKERSLIPVDCVGRLAESADRNIPSPKRMTLTTLAAGPGRKV